MKEIVRKFDNGALVVRIFTDEAQTLVLGQSQEALDELGKALTDEIKRFVSPGVGPGPHPHRTPHIDTGELRDDIFYQVDKSKEPSLIVGNRGKAYYGKYLELGWKTDDSFYRYPWLMSTIEKFKVGPSLAEFFQEKFVKHARKVGEHIPEPPLRGSV